MRDRAPRLKHQPRAALKQLGRLLRPTGHETGDFLSPGTEPRTQPGAHAEITRRVMRRRRSDGPPSNPAWLSRCCFCRRRLNTGPPAPVWIWASGVAVGVCPAGPVIWARSVDRDRRTAVAWCGAVGGDQANEAGGGSLAARDPPPDGRPSRHDPPGAGVWGAAALWPRPPRPSKLDRYVPEIERLLADDPRLSGVRVREEIEQLGYDGRRTILDDLLRALRPRFLPPPRSFQRTRYRPGELAQFDLCEPRTEIPVGWGQTRRGYLVRASCRTRARSLARWCSRRSSATSPGA
jgi:hypothetical protein